MLSFIKCFERVLIKIISDLFPDNIQYNLDNEQAGTETMLAFKVEHTKVPEFFGQKNKDTITVIIFI
jgi:hypothetical protein